MARWMSTVKKAPDRIYLRVAPSGAIMPVIHTEPPKGSQRSVQYVRADLLDVKTLLKISSTRVDNKLGVNPLYDAAFEDGHGGG